MVSEQDDAPPTKAVLEAAFCWEPGTDQVPGQPAVTAFKQKARLHQARWREAREYPIGSQPMVQRAGGPEPRPLGSRIDLAFAEHRKVNILSDAARRATSARLATPQRHQTLNPQRLWADLLSSMPMCFSLFGAFADDLGLARDVLPVWFPEIDGEVQAVHLEWSPGRVDVGFLNNRTAFDAAIEFSRSDGSRGILGIETKYHEHAVAEKTPGDDRLPRYRAVSDASGVFNVAAIDDICGTELQQVWLDHLLALAMLQHESQRWTLAHFVVVHPARNPSFADACSRYAQHLGSPESFSVRTIESLLDDGGALPPELRDSFVERYLW